MSPSRLALFLSLSLAANAALVGYVTLRPAAPYGAASPGGVSAPVSSSSPRARVRAQLPAADALAAAVSADLPTYTENLRKAGVPDRFVRAIINAEINERYRTREEALRPKREERQYWESREDYYRDDGLTLEQRLARLDLRREKAALRKKLLGENPSAKPDDNPVPPEKRALARDISEDYGAMIEQIRRESRGYTLPADEEKIRYLEAEKRRELAGILTPAELREYDLRSSQTAQQLKWNLAAFSPAEEEFRALHELQSAFDEKYPSRNNGDQEYWRARNEAQKGLREQIKAVLGEERYKDYERSQDWEYRNLLRLTERLGLEPAAASRIHDLRDTVGQEAKKIVEDKSLSAAVRREAVVQLIEETRAQIISQLGEEAGQAYLKSQSEWLGTRNDYIRVKTGEHSWQHLPIPKENEDAPPAVRVVR
ncbi:hypothetical protein OpiT1DRAFT_05816 [Opitutaceae bacterium TAV1]|nr:hypothetical protein OpiT1DRAFT_05816 [Opitutaceae bacterium TAV1]